MFSFPNFVRRTPPERLRMYFVDRHKVNPQIDWSGSRLAQSALIGFVQQMPERQAEQIYADFEQVGQLCDDVGQRALRSMVLNDLDAFDALDGDEARGFERSHPRSKRVQARAVHRKFGTVLQWAELEPLLRLQTGTAFGYARCPGEFPG